MRRLRSDSGAVAVEFRPGDGSDLVGGGHRLRPYLRLSIVSAGGSTRKAFVRGRSVGGGATCGIHRRNVAISAAGELSPALTTSQIRSPTKTRTAAQRRLVRAELLVTVTVTYPLTSLTGMSHRPSRARILRERV